MSGNWTLLWKYMEISWTCSINLQKLEMPHCGNLEGANELGCTAPQMWNYNGLHGAGCPLDCGSFNMENIPTCRRTWGHFPIALIGGQCHLSCCLISACLFSLFDSHLHLSVANSQNWRFHQDVLFFKIFWRCFPSFFVYPEMIRWQKHFDRKHEGATTATTGYNCPIALSYCSEKTIAHGILAQLLIPPTSDFLMFFGHLTHPNTKKKWLSSE